MRALLNCTIASVRPNLLPKEMWKGLLCKEVASAHVQHCGCSRNGLRRKSASMSRIGGIDGGVCPEREGNVNLFGDAEKVALR